MEKRERGENPKELWEGEVITKSFRDSAILR